ncbi:MAG TPA: tRNA lysidine(34) synthetase TilS [Woeseiaceae bacterium]|nr:tRNA lysidine(34) synthetase TilS [Woeseiaceae bacterium]
MNGTALVEVLRSLERRAAAPARYVVALSGGLDSTVLLHALAASRDEHGVPLAAVHVDHGLHPHAPRWAADAMRFAAALGVECRIVAVEVGAGGGPEAAAREARYAALAAAMSAGDWLLSAHHEDDQAETLLLNLLRGSGPAGLAGMPRIRPFGPGYLARPLLGTTRSELARYAAAAGLEWNDDPSNADEAYDRNYLRTRILPLLASRWPDAAGRLARSAFLAGESTTLLQELADADLGAHATGGALPGGGLRLPVAALAALSRPRAANLLRRGVHQAGLPPIPATRLATLQDTLLEARDDANPLVRWPGAQCRRFRDHVYLLPPDAEPDFEGRVLTPDVPLALGVGRGELALERSVEGGIDPALAGPGLVLRTRHGGEEIRPRGHAHTRKLKKLLQERNVLPWHRDALPLLYAGETLVAVADLWVAADAVAAPGYVVRWRHAPAYVAPA